jgi:prepilin-type N-terminal cleavage/methylation domain-containing protein
MRAFSLIELLVTISIIAILSVIVLAGLSTGKTEKELEGASQIVVSALRDAQNKALTGSQFVANTTPCSYRFSWNGAGGTLIYIYKNGTLCSQSATVSTVALSSGVTFSNSGNVDFSLPHGETTATTIRLTKSGQNNVVCVRDGGLVEVLSGAVCN